MRSKNEGGVVRRTARIARRRGAAGAGEELVAGKGAAKGNVKVMDVGILVAWESTFSLLLCRSF